MLINGFWMALKLIITDIVHSFGGGHTEVPRLWIYSGFADSTRMVQVVRGLFAWTLFRHEMALDLPFWAFFNRLYVT